MYVVVYVHRPRKGRNGPLTVGTQLFWGGYFAYNGSVLLTDTVRFAMAFCLTMVFACKWTLGLSTYFDNKLKQPNCKQKAALERLKKFALSTC